MSILAWIFWTALAVVVTLGLLAFACMVIVASVLKDEDFMQ